MSERDLSFARYDEAQKNGHVESYFIKANHRDERRALWLKATIFAPPGDRSAALGEAWAIAFDRERGHVAVKESVPLAKAEFARSALSVRVAETTLGEERACGHIETAGRSIRWDLRLRPRGQPLVHYPHAWMYRAPFPSSKLVSPMPDLRVTGELMVDGERWEVDDWPGLLGHNWGRGHAHLYAWAHCNVWDDDVPLVFEGLSGRVKVGPLLTPTMTILCVRYEGVDYPLNGLRRSLRNHGDITTRRWRFDGRGRDIAIEGELWGETEDFVGLFYANPQGPMTHCLNSKLANARLKITLRGRAPFVVRSRAAALEVGTHDTKHGIRMHV